MARSPRTATRWPIYFMVFTALVILVFMVVGFSALGDNNLALAFPIFGGIVALLLFEIVLFIIYNRLQG